MMMRKANLLVVLVALLGLAAGGSLLFARAPDGPPTVTVYKSPTCGCCKKWVEHLEQNGFETKVVEMENVEPMKDQLGVPRMLRSCHTGVVNGYVVEGHVPADLIQQMVKEKPEITGLTVPGMPVGSPGMEVGDRKEPYDVVAFTKDGKQSVYASR